MQAPRGTHRRTRLPRSSARNAGGGAGTSRRHQYKARLSGGGERDGHLLLKDRMWDRRVFEENYHRESLGKEGRYCRAQEKEAIY